MEHDLFGKPASILGSSPRTGFFRIMLKNAGRIFLEFFALKFRRLS